MNELEFYLAVLQALEEIGAKYMVVGAYGASAYGLGRSTHDVDMIVDLDEAACQALAEHFPPPQYYADPEQMSDSIRLGIMFNIIDTDVGVKADLVPLSREPEYRAAFERRRRITVIGPDRRTFEIWCAQPEDIIVGKLRAWQEGRSAKHPRDIHSMLTFLLSGPGQQELDIDDITRQATRIGPEVLAVWQEILARVRQEV